jgi:hypothetical protein
VADGEILYGLHLPRKYERSRNHAHYRY